MNFAACIAENIIYEHLQMTDLKIMTILPAYHVICFVTMRGGVAQWVARLTFDRWIIVSREFEPHQRPSLFP